MDNFKISDFLDNFNSITKNGGCKVCNSTVTWSRQRVASHKRTNCAQISEEEIVLFSKKAKLQETSLNSSSQLLEFDLSSSTIVPKKEELDKLIANLFFRTGMSFRIADSPAWKTLIANLNPEYAKDMPTSRTIGGKLLKERYQEAAIQVNDILKETEDLVLSSDGWKDTNGEHIVNFIVISRHHDPFFYKSICTTGIQQNAVAIADEIGLVIEEIGVSKFSAVITDSPNVMILARKLLVERYPTISAYGCAAHGVNLLIKDIVALPEYAKTTKEASKLIQFVNNHQMCLAKFEAKRKEAGVAHKLTAPALTRWAYDLFGQMFQHYEQDDIVQQKVKSRWGKNNTKCTEIAFMLTPKHASDGFFLNDKLEVFELVKNYVELRYSDQGLRAEREMIEFVAKMSDLPTSKREALFKLSAQEYWKIFGRKEFPTLYLCAKQINSMICSSASSERA
jgi:hypothetical protein